MIKVLELFAGIGACSKALTNIGIDIEIVDAVENSYKTIDCYNKIHKTNFKRQDINTWSKDIDVDLLFHGSPCQDISVAGNQKGANENSNTRSSLLWKTVHIVENVLTKKPRYIIWENVKALINNKNKHILSQYIQRLNAIGYQTTWKVLNAKDFKIPQNRERIFVVSFYDRRDYSNFSWSKVDAAKCYMKPISKFLDKKVDKQYYLNKEVNEVKEFTNFIVIPRNDGTLTNGSYNRYWKTDKDSSFIGAISVATRPKIIDKSRYRILTPRECMLLMGFSIEDYDAIKDKSDSLIYKVTGNSIVVDVLKALFRSMFCCVYCVGMK